MQMKIIGTENEKVILTELGERIKQQRVTLGITQAEMASKCGVSASTVTRIENGFDSMALNYIRILSGLDMLANLDILVPEVQPDFKSMYEKKKPRQRARTGSQKQEAKWTWEEDK